MIAGRIAAYRTGRLKTTIDIADDLAREAKAHAAHESTTLRALVERGLRLAIQADIQQRRFMLRDAWVIGRGLQASSRDADWAAIRQMVYGERGG